MINTEKKVSRLAREVHQEARHSVPVWAEVVASPVVSAEADSTHQIRMICSGMSAAMHTYPYAKLTDSLHTAPSSAAWEAWAAEAAEAAIHSAWVEEEAVSSSQAADSAGARRAVPDVPVWVSKLPLHRRHHHKRSPVRSPCHWKSYTRAAPNV